MFKNKNKINISEQLRLLLKNGARRPFIFFLILFFAGAAISAVIFLIFRQSYFSPGTSGNLASRSNKLFNDSKMKDYQALFEALNFREADYANATSTVSHRGIFQELTKTKN